MLPGGSIFFMFGFLSLLLCVAWSFNLLTLSIKKIIVGYQSRNWCATESTIVAYKILPGGNNARNEPNYGFTTSYRYIVNGVAFISQFEQRGFQSLQVVEREINAKYALGKKSEIIYSPKNPHSCVLARGLQLPYFCNLAGATVLFSMAIGCLLILIFISLDTGHLPIGCFEFNSVQRKWISVQCSGKSGGM